MWAYTKAQMSPTCRTTKLNHMYPILPMPTANEIFVKKKREKERDKEKKGIHI